MYSRLLKWSGFFLLAIGSPAVFGQSHESPKESNPGTLSAEPRYHPIIEKMVNEEIDRKDFWKDLDRLGKLKGDLFCKAVNEKNAKGEFEGKIKALQSEIASKADALSALRLQLQPKTKELKDRIGVNLTWMAVAALATASSITFFKKGGANSAVELRILIGAIGAGSALTGSLSAVQVALDSIQLGKLSDQVNEADSTLKKTADHLVTIRANILKCQAMGQG